METSFITVKILTKGGEKFEGGYNNESMPYYEDTDKFDKDFYENLKSGEDLVNAMRQWFEETIEEDSVDADFIDNCSSGDIEEITGLNIENIMQIQISLMIDYGDMGFGCITEFDYEKQKFKETDKNYNDEDDVFEFEDFDEDSEGDFEGDFEFELNEKSEAVITSYTGEKRNVVIPAELDGNYVVGIDEGAFSEGEFISITIPDTVTSIGVSAFADCRNLTNITIPGSVASIGEDAFRDCISLTSVTIPDSVTSLGCHAFDGTPYLESLKGDFVIIGKILHKYMGNNQEVVIPDGVTIIGDCAFEGCDITSVTIPEGVTSIGVAAFECCTCLTSIAIPKSVKTIATYAFFRCERLANVMIPDSVTSIDEDAFCGTPYSKSL